MTNPANPTNPTQPTQSSLFGVVPAPTSKTNPPAQTPATPTTQTPAHTDTAPAQTPIAAVQMLDSKTESKQDKSEEKQNLSALIWSVADLLRGDYKQSDYGKVILPFTILRRLDVVLESSKADVLAKYQELLEKNAEKNAEKNSEKTGDKTGDKTTASTPKTNAGLDPLWDSTLFATLLKKAAGDKAFYNVSPLTLQQAFGDADNLYKNIMEYIRHFSKDARDIFEKFEFLTQLEKLHKAKLLYQVTERFMSDKINLHPDVIDNLQMGQVFEELIRKWAEASNETAGEHFTPREVIRLIVDLILVEDSETLTAGAPSRAIYDPTAGTGGMLSEAEARLKLYNQKVRVAAHGQELNPESFAVCKADMLIKGQEVKNIILGNTLSEDGHKSVKFDYMLSNPPFGVEWKKVEKEVKDEHTKLGFAGRFGPGLPRISDGSMLFLLHLLSKMRPKESGGCRFGIVLNGSPLFTGGAGSGESEIRKYVLENDLVEAIVGLPTDMFYNTGIATYIWILSNKKPDARKGKVQLIDASSFWQKMRKSLGSKRKEMNDGHIADVVKLFGDFVEAQMVILQDDSAVGSTKDAPELKRTLLRADASDAEKHAARTLTRTQTDEHGVVQEVVVQIPESRIKVVPISRIFANQEFGYRSVTIERPKYDEKGNKIIATKGKNKGKVEADSALRDSENIPLSEDVQSYFAREVLPHAPDAWIDESSITIGYEIPFNRHFYVFDPPRSLSEIDQDLKSISGRIMTMLQELG